MLAVITPSAPPSDTAAGFAAIGLGCAADTRSPPGRVNEGTFQYKIRNFGYLGMHEIVH